jgi:hypothetical protein
VGNKYHEFLEALLLYKNSRSIAAKSKSFLKTPVQLACREEGDRRMLDILLKHDPEILRS